MNKIKRKIFNIAGKIADKVVDNTSQAFTDVKTAIDYNRPETAALCRQAAAEGIVLLKNKDNILPLSKGNKISVFSRMQYDWFFMGYGSGGDVNAPYYINILDGLRAQGAQINEDLSSKYAEFVKKHPADKGIWAHWPTNLEEMKLKASDVEDAAKVSDTAIIILGRSSGEDMDNRYEKGSWFLDKAEKDMIDKVTGSFSRVILLINSSNIMDMSEITAYGDKLTAILYVWQGGMESGNAVADVLMGSFPACGKLPDTIAVNYEAYPTSKNFGDKDINVYEEDIYVGYRYFETFAKDKVLYPFGFGLSYTDFNIETLGFEKNEESVFVTCRITNTGKADGKETAQIYLEAPQGKLGKPARVLVAFAKTDILKPGESEEIKQNIKLETLASYDDKDLYAYILEKGTYTFYLGSDVRSAKKCGEFILDEDIIVEQLTQCSAAAEPFKRMINSNGKVDYEDVPLAKVSVKDKILASLPGGILSEECPKELVGSKLQDVIDGKITLDEFVLTLDNDELEAISRGDYTMDSPLGPKGNAGALGGVLESMREKGIPPIICTDGPTGIRIGNIASLMPIGTCLSSTFNTPLVEALHKRIGAEMKELGTMVLLSPGLNIHRAPLNGRNFEYYSEDPYLTGSFATACVKGVQSEGVAACPKHYACNDQEYNRIYNDSRLSERALREIHLKGFEMVVKEAKPLSIMTSYNKINGVWGHYHYELIHDILRGEWEFDGCVITDWWMRASKSPEFPEIRDQAYRVRACVNVLMPGGERPGTPKANSREPDGTLLETLGKEGGITIAELRENAKYVLKFAMHYMK